MLRVINKASDICTVLDDDDFTIEQVHEDSVMQYIRSGGSVTFEKMPVRFSGSGNGYVLYEGENKVNIRLLLKGGKEVYKTTEFVPRDCDYDIKLTSLEDYFYVISIYYTIGCQLFSKMVIVTVNGKLIRRDVDFQREADIIGYKYRNGVLSTKY